MLMQSLELDPRLDLEACALLHQKLLEAHDTGGHLVIDAGRVERLCSSALQVLVSAKVSFSASHQGLNIINPSPAFEAALSDFGCLVSEIASETVEIHTMDKDN